MVKMNISLRKRDGDAVLVQLLLGLLGQIEPQGPVVFPVGPAAQVHIDRAVGQLFYHNLMSGVVENPFIILQDFVQDPHRLVNIVGVTNPYHEIQPAGRQPRVVLDRGRGKLRVRYHQKDTVPGLRFRRKESDFSHGPSHAAGVNALADLEWP